MAIKTVMAAYFSPAGSTRKVTAAVAAGLAESLGAKLREFNWTVKKNREWRLEFTPSDLLVVGVPTYAGRIPNKMISYVQDNLLVDQEIVAARRVRRTAARRIQSFLRYLLSRTAGARSTIRWRRPPVF